MQLVKKLLVWAFKPPGWQSFVLCITKVLASNFVGGLMDQGAMEVEWRLMILKKSKVKVNDRPTDPCLCPFMSIDPSSMPPEKKAWNLLPPQRKKDAPNFCTKKKAKTNKALRTHPTWESAEPVDKIWWCNIPCVIRVYSFTGVKCFLISKWLLLFLNNQPVSFCGKHLWT